MRTQQGLLPQASTALVVRFGACEFETDVPATRDRLAKDLDKSCGQRRRGEILVRVERSSESRAALTDVALAGGGSKLCQPGDRAALLEFLDEHPQGFLVMAMAPAAVGRGALPVMA